MLSSFAVQQLALRGWGLACGRGRDLAGSVWLWEVLQVRRLGSWLALCSHLLPFLWPTWSSELVGESLASGRGFVDNRPRIGGIHSSRLQGDADEAGKPLNACHKGIWRAPAWAPEILMRTLPLMKDIRDPRVMWLKAVLLLLVAVLSSVMLLIEALTWKTAVLLVLTIWGFCRAYYFAFYALEHYVDSSCRYSGLAALIRYILRKK